MMRTRTTILILLLALAAVVALAATACSSSTGSTTSSPPATSGGAATSTPSTSGGATTIVEKNFAFSPSNATVKVGDTVTFKNQDTVAHRVDVNGKDLGLQNPGADVTWTADKAGTFPVKCLIHPSMTGQITVQ
jgi:plastocyanin